jgi:hypothetical protein
LRQTCTLLATHTAPGALNYICMDWRHTGELVTAGEAAYSQLINICVWVKHNGGMGSLYRSQHELVFVFKNGEAAHCNNVQLGKYGRNRTNVWNYRGINDFGATDGRGQPPRDASDGEAGRACVGRDPGLLAPRRPRP